MKKLNLKTPAEIKIMTEGGRMLGEIKNKAARAVKEGFSSWDIEELVTREIEKTGGIPSFKMVHGYSWSTCINVNEGVVHGIPKKTVIFHEGDVVSIDLGLFYKGFHTDTAISVEVGSNVHAHFLDVGRASLKNAIRQAKIGKSIADISEAMESTLKSASCNPMKQLTGHGVGRELHEDPAVPCFVSGRSFEKIKLVEGLVLAIEVMYSEGKGDIIIEDDGWTISTIDGKISALFEESVAVTSNGPAILTK